MRRPLVPVLALLGSMALAHALSSCGSAVVSPSAPAPHAGVAASAGAGAEEPASPPPLHKVADLPERAELWHLGGGSLLLQGVKDSFWRIHGHAVEPLPGLDRGLDLDDGTEDRGSIHRIIGRWPDPVWLVWRGYDTWSAAHNMWFERLFRLRGDRWEKIDEARHDESGNELYRGLWEQPRGCLVGLLSDDREISDAWTARQEVLDCPGRPAAALPFVATKQTEYATAAVLGFDSGDVMVLEHPARMKEGAPAPARLAISRPGAPNRTEIDLPLPPDIEREQRSFRLDRCKLLGWRPTEVHVLVNLLVDSEPGAGPQRGTASSPLLFRFDGASLSQVAMPPVDTVLQADLAEDGTLVVLGSPPRTDPAARVVWALPPHEEWIRIPMPSVTEGGEPYRPWSVAARSLRDIWVVGYHEGAGGKDRRHALFHSRLSAGSAPGSGAANP